MRAMVTTATAAPPLSSIARLTADAGIGSPMGAAISTVAGCVGCLSNFRRPTRLVSVLTALLEALEAGKGRRRSSALRVGCVDHVADDATGSAVVIGA